MSIDLLTEYTPVRLNLGSGANHLDGYDNIDRMYGSEVYPLDVPDESVDEIRASHVFEHFSHTQAGAVMENWVSKLKPGGLLKIAVPDFLAVAQQYVAGAPINVQGYVMGGHKNEDDHHGMILDEEALRELMVSAGLTRISKWTEETKDCSSLPISLNLCGYKSTKCDVANDEVVAVLATARFAPALHHKCTHDAFHKLGIFLQVSTTCFWWKGICEGMETAIQNPKIKYVITGDFDSLFSADDVLEMIRLMEAYGVDAIAPLQSKRGGGMPMFTVGDGSGRIMGQLPAQKFLGQNLLEVDTAHFGLTIFRADKLREFPRPWMQATPDKDGRWRDGEVDFDVTFWRNWRAAGNHLYLANRVAIGHMEEVIVWPTEDFSPRHQYVKDYVREGKPSWSWK